MQIINLGSLNLDHVYRVQRFVQPGETMSAISYTLCCGGKGLNQSIAAARAGASVQHIGMLGQGGEPLLQCLRESGVDTSLIHLSTVPQGHAVIQVAESGENCILLYAGSNFALTPEIIDQLFAQVKPPAYLLLQNEISELSYIIRRAADAGFQIMLNASPFDPSLRELDYGLVSWLMINEVEGMQLSGHDQPEGILAALHERFPNLGIVLTLGKAGCICLYGAERSSHKAYRVQAVDTTAAGDTFTGYFAAALAQGMSPSAAAERASAAAALSVTRAGAAPSIPTREEVDNFLLTHT